MSCDKPRTKADIANAALMEVGLAPAFVDSDGTIMIDVFLAREPLYARAAYLGILAIDGPNAPCRCPTCAGHWQRREHCTTPSEALRGYRCES